MIDEALARNPEDRGALNGRALLLGQGRAACRGATVAQADGSRRPREDERITTPRMRAHVSTPLPATPRAAVHWLEETATHGMPVYPAFARDSCFDPIRGSAPFIRFMTELKPVWDEVRSQDAIAVHEDSAGVNARAASR